ncbi:nucleoside hydrolase [Neobittarella massiliensis]|uniref:Nucleoside hydrolase n=1 Tax=Neobittarella massiliensis (ex Bilen et al. 2018) TaxID=2041842 RepID=A0A8J6ICN6_9FIRM|nr:nucleoside hydrolase [Neobittarella massiliensis]MBC3514820.1 nucleoside hydrolase [Neobittarella massiliensis]
MKKIIIDTDTASDDAVALVMALREPALEVLAITAVAGNVTLDLATKNACLAATYADTYLPPIYAGAERPLVRALNTATNVHGEDGMGDMPAGFFKEPATEPQPQRAVDAIIDLIAGGDGDIELVTLGPLTNIALAILQAPEVMKKVPHITMMGGAAFAGNANPTAEFNIWVDAEAADVVFASGIPITMATIEACFGSAKFTPEEIEQLQRSQSEVAHFCADCNRTLIDLNASLLGEPGLDLPDPTAIAILARPELIQGYFTGYARVETAGSALTDGMVVCDRRAPQTVQAMAKGSSLHRHNATVVYEIDGPAFKEYLLSLVL